MPRLVNRGNAFAATTTTTLPTYEPPSCELDEEASRKLRDLANNRGHSLYEAQVKECIRQLGLSVRDVNERLFDQRDRLDILRSRRCQKKGDQQSSSEEELRLSQHVTTFQVDVDDLSRLSESALRDCIDMRVELEDEATILDQLVRGSITTTSSTRAAATAAAPAAADDDEDDNDNDNNNDDDKKPSAPSILKAFRQARTEKSTEYKQTLSPYQRYAVQNDYISFKKSWHDASAGKDGPPLADASKWFRPDGQPVMDRLVRSSGHYEKDDVPDDDLEDDDDDEIAVAREVISVNCPLTLRPMVEPYSNNKCKHTFEKSAIVDYLSRQSELQCPQTGCSAMFSHSTFNQDFHLDDAILRKIQRDQETRRNRELDDDDIEDE